MVERDTTPPAASPEAVAVVPATEFAEAGLSEAGPFEGGPAAIRNSPADLLAASLRASLLLAVVIVGVGAISYLATFDHAYQSSGQTALLAVAGVLMATLPALWFWALFSNGAARQMASIAWRFLAVLFLLAIAANWEETARNCYFSVLLPCYFVALSLESWLLIRECQLTTG